MMLIEKYITLILEEEIASKGPSPVQIGSLYLHKEELMQEVQKTMNDLAPQGVNSQGEYIEILEKALNQVDQKMHAGGIGPNSEKEAMVADMELTLSMIERTLRMIPYQVFFAQNR